ncbi:MAG: hypothetical protein VYD19_01905, partial [Myxococcota bacterium]|nr:hypothetical protein [Myxococcota bacterium]
MRRSDFQTRQATLADEETLLRFTLDEAEEAEGRAEPAEVICAAIRRALTAPEESAYYFVAHRVGSEALLGHVSVTREWSDWNNAHYVWIT